jgi:signal transduction histidine kinase
VQNGKMTMSEINSNMSRRISDGPISSLLLEMILHVMGNGFAVIWGYTHLLQRAVSTQAQAAFPPELDIWQQQNERWLSYLQTMRHEETLLNDFLAQLRELWPMATKERFSQCFVRTDLVLLLRRITERLAPLHQNRTIQTHLPVQPLYVMCDLLWIELVLEHVINHTVDAHTLSTPVDIWIEHYEDPSKMLQEARIGIRIKRGLIRQKPGTEERFETWSQTLDTRGQDVCIAVCREVLREHGGRIWNEQKAEQEEVVYLALPQVE